MPSALLLILGGDIPGLVAVTPASAAAAKSAYAMTDLGSLGDGVSLGFGINDPFSRTAGAMTDLGTSSATAMSETTAVNRGRDVVGGSGGQGQEHAFLLTQLVSAPRIYRPPA